MNDTDIDVRPGTLPPWVVRCARRETDGGEEWLVLADSERATAAHTCDRRLNDNRSVYRVAITQRFTERHSTCGCIGIFCDGGEMIAVGSLAEAEAAFAKIEAEWLGRDA